MAASTVLSLLRSTLAIELCETPLTGCSQHFVVARSEACDLLSEIEAVIVRGHNHGIALHACQFGTPEGRFAIEFAEARLV